MIRNWLLFTWLGTESSKAMQSPFRNTSLLILLVSATRSESTEFWTGGAAMGCMAISWILLGTRLLASEERDILSTCSKIEAEECCSFPLLVWGGPKLSEPIQSEAVLPGLAQSNVKLYRCCTTKLCPAFHLCLICPTGLPADSCLVYNKFTPWFANYKHFPIIFPEGELSFFISVNQALGTCKPPKPQSTFLHKKLFKYILLMIPLIST